MTRIGFFTRLLDDAPPAERYRIALEQIVHAERHGFASAWVAQHHFHEAEGGLPSPFVLLAAAAARTTAIRLGTGVVTLPLEDPVRVAEDAVVLDLLSGGRVELGLGSGSTPASFRAFGQEHADRGPVFGRKTDELVAALAGGTLGDDANRLHPPGRGLLGRIWQATFSPFGGTRAGQAGHGLMLSRTQPRGADAVGRPLSEVQQPVVDAYLEALPGGVPPRVLASRTLFVADDRDEARRFAERGLRRAAASFARMGQLPAGDSLDDLIAAFDTHVGTPEDVIESLSRDTVASSATEVAFQVHSVDPPHELVLRSIELIASEVAPALGWAVAGADPASTRTLERTSL
ncbi:putative FMN-dependent luciferase-like monooxygenase [Agromyces archimandritae]|uniref:FMN-dependent luciferase-like monooxygenase n=1 Tax=Agromyces archimandritae TaxID=2781962 RepID=A0A975FKD5_9MICO|nr:putative FMN-dependent luciferase-like monooxygenase [Agromyces archimandritae]QTX03670.1 putative FMN-dependent luciferase-like monooxygenase [Agromyces archimandritae]